MFMMDLSDVLEMPSHDGFAFRRCSKCGISWRAWASYGKPATGRPCACENADEWSCETVGQLIGAKMRDPWFPTLLADIRENGKNTPALIEGGAMWNGHHGIAALVELGWAEIPVTYSGIEYMASEESSDWDEGSPSLGYGS